ncbi:uncharacterized protein LOC101459649 [Ceratitis capitata]|uniref:uncharacterized protein LOC101459649 n=1 Tax=Ceratitis capitata TaxID=7213 RepID=UPI00032A1198|nr:uncharacterized protein LOC101459649 [Ceratitis capitata]
MDPSNMLFRLEDLTPEKLYEEYHLSKEDIRRHRALYKAYVDDFIPTRADLERKLTDEQLKELCLRRSCRVLMYRWNPVQDFIDQFTRQGRIQRWTKEKTEKLIIKGISRHKDVCMYSEEEIRIERERQWCERKKENLMRLELWEYDRIKKQPPQQEKIDLSSTKEDDVHIDVTHSEELANTVIVSPPTDVEALMAALHNSPLQSRLSDVLTITEQLAHIGALSTTTNISSKKQPSITDSIIPPLTESQSTLIPSTQNTEELAVREYAEMVEQVDVNANPILADYLNVNTESMQFEDSVILDSEADCDGTPPYCDFNDHISFTSTQSPSVK